MSYDSKWLDKWQSLHSAAKAAGIAREKAARLVTTVEQPQEQQPWVVLSRALKRDGARWEDKHTCVVGCSSIVTPYPFHLAEGKEPAGNSWGCSIFIGCLSVYDQ